jgi:hypothetical protein
MAKKLLMIFIMFTMLIAAGGCASPQNPLPDPEADISQDKMAIIDNNGMRIGDIDSRANATAVDNGIFYSIFELTEYQPTATAQYRFFDKETKTDVLLGEFEDQSYEAFYTRAELNGSLYCLAIRGPAGSDCSALVLLCFDLNQKTMKTFTVSESGFPYTNMAVVNGRLLIINHEMDGSRLDKVYEFNPLEETVREVLSFSADVDSLRAIAPGDEGFYLLRLKIKADGENEMMLDHYGADYTKKAEQSIHEAMVNAIMNLPTTLSRQDALYEVGMNVLHFAVVQGRYLFYENFSVSRLVIDLQSGEALFCQDDLYSFSSGSGQPVIYRQDFEQSPDGPEILTLENGKLVKLPFKPVSTHQLLRSVSRSADGSWLIITSDTPQAFNWTLAAHLLSE